MPATLALHPELDLPSSVNTCAGHKSSPLRPQFTFLQTRTGPRAPPRLSDARGLPGFPAKSCSTPPASWVSPSPASRPGRRAPHPSLGNTPHIRRPLSSQPGHLQRHGPRLGQILHYLFLAPFSLPYICFCYNFTLLYGYFNRIPNYFRDPKCMDTMSALLSIMFPDLV